MKVVLYARVSTARQAEKDLSIPDQLHQMQNYCRQHKHAVVKEYREEGASATDDKRPAFQEMMGDILNGKLEAEAILVLTTSRFFRDATAARIWKHNLRKKGIRVIATSQEVTDDPMGDFVEGIFELIDQYESQMNGYHTLRGMKENARRGYINGALSPFGYSRSRVTDERGNPKTRLEVNPEEAVTVRHIYSLYVNGRNGNKVGAKQIADLLNAEGVSTGKRAKWSKQRVLSILSDTLYIGECIFNRYDSRNHLEKPREEWITIQVEPIVDLESYEKAQRVRASHEPTLRPGRTVSSPLLLAGLVKCGHCGAAMTLETGKGGNYRYYNCRRFLREGKSVCVGQRIPCADFEKAILDHMADVVFSEKRVKTIVDEVSKAQREARRTVSSATARLNKQLVTVELKLKRQLDAIEAGAVDLEIVGRRVQELRQERESLHQQLEEHRIPKPVPSSLHGRENTCAVQGALKQLFFTTDSAIGRRYMHYLVDEIVVKGTEVQIRGKSTAFLNTLAQKNNVRAGDLPVLTLGHTWLRGQDSNL